MMQIDTESDSQAYIDPLNKMIDFDITGTKWSQASSISVPSNNSDSNFEAQKASVQDQMIVDKKLENQQKKMMTLSKNKEEVPPLIQTSKFLKEI